MDNHIKKALLLLFFKYNYKLKTQKTMLSDKITDHEVAPKVDFCFR
jgi:hypothetical protein